MEYIERQSGDEPFFMFVGLPNPHMPFDCPEPYASLYDPAEMPVPPSFADVDLSGKPPGHAAFRRGGRRVNYEELDEPRLRRLLNPVDNHETFREFALDGPAAELAVAPASCSSRWPRKAARSAV